MPNISLYFVRHGQRIDQIDSSWAITSPSPQDPPLTQLGKLQARQTGKMIRDFAYESSSSSLSPPSFFAEPNLLKVSASKIQGAAVIGVVEVNADNDRNHDNEGNNSVPQQQEEGGARRSSSSHESSSTLQRMTPPESPDFSRVTTSTSGAISQSQQDQTSHQGAGTIATVTTTTTTTTTQRDDRTARRASGPSTLSPLSSSAFSHGGRSKKTPHHFAIVTSPFLRCSQTAIEMAIGMRSSSASGKTMSTTTAATGTDTRQQQEDGGDAVTIAVETGLSEWLSMDYVSGQPPESIIVQRIQEFAMSRRDHEQYYSIDWKYQAKDRTLPSWPESREEMQARLERSLAHVLLTYTGNGNSNNKYKDYDLSIVFVTHASPVNALLEACLETPILVPVPNCSISRCRWTLISSTDSSQEHTTNDNDKDSAASGLPNVLVQSMRTHTIAGEDGRWLLDYQTHTSHLDRDRR